VFNQVGEVSHGAHGDSIFWRVLDLMVAQSLMGDDHLRVGFCSESSRFKKGDLIPDASFVHVSTSLNVVYGINHKINVFPEFVTEHIFCIFTYARSVRFSV